MKRFLIFALALIFALSLVSCSGENDNNDQNIDDEYIESSDVSAEKEKYPDRNVIANPIKIITDFEHCFFDSKMSFSIIVDSENEFTYGNEYYVEYYDNGNWKRCEKEFSFTEEAYVATFEAKLSFTLSDRADVGKEKYRIVMNISHNNKVHTVYSNEFTAE